MSDLESRQPDTAPTNASSRSGMPAAATPTSSSPPSRSASASAPSDAPPTSAANATGRRRGALLALTTVVLVAGAAWGAYWALVLRHQESTDNAYVQAPVVQITPQVSGTVLEVLVDDTDVVQAGQVLLRIDPTDARLALDRAEAQLAQTVREVRTLYANNAAADASIALREAELRRAAADRARAEDDVARRQPLLASGAVGGEEMKHAEAALAAARSAQSAAEAALAAARKQAVSGQALTDGTDVERHPSVQRAAAAVREAMLALERTELTAPVGGQIARRNVQPGQRVAAGGALMSVVSLERAWVEANFKEVQLRRMRVGQPVELVADLYGSKVSYRGHVAGLGAGTGAAFALLPAQNATGNWIKIVQRVPVRIELDDHALQAHPLRVGLSMEATVDVDAGGDAVPLVSAGAPRTVDRAAVPATADAAAGDRRVREIIDANLGRTRAAAAGQAASHTADASRTSVRTAASARTTGTAPRRLAASATGSATR
jgi:membrane fusion protein (multidrug efflux system)